MKRKSLVAVLTLVVMASLTVVSHAASKTKQEIYTGPVDRQFSKSSVLLGGVPATITIIADQSEEARVNAIMEQMLTSAAQLDMTINGTPDGEVAKINELSKGDTHVLSDDMYNLLLKAKELAGLTNGRFDVTTTEGGYKKISLNETDKSITWKNGDMKLDVSLIWPAYLVDKMMSDIEREGLPNAKVEVGAVSRNKGQDIHTQWKVSLNIPNPESNYAYRSFVYSFSNKAVAVLPNMATTVTQNNSENKNNFKNIMVFGNDSMTAMALALALYTLDKQDALTFAAKHPEIKGIFVDENGKFVNSKDFVVGRPAYEEAAVPAVPAAAAVNGGENVQNSQETQQ